MNDKRACARQGRVCISALYRFLSIHIYGDMEMAPIYTDTHFKTTSPKCNRGSKSENRLREDASGAEKYDCIHYTDIRSRGIRWTKAPRIEEGVTEASRDRPEHAQGNNKRLTTTDYKGRGFAENTTGRERARSTT